MDKSKNTIAILGVGISIGVVLAVFAIVFLKANPTSINMGPVEFEIPTPTWGVSPNSSSGATATQDRQQSQAITPPETSSQTDCSKMIEGKHHKPILGTEWSFEAIDENRIIHIWSNHWENNLPEFKYFLPAGQTVSFMSGGGSFWTEKPGCNRVAQVIYDRDTFKEITLDDYQKYIEQKVIP